LISNKLNLGSNRLIKANIERDNISYTIEEINLAIGPIETIRDYINNRIDPILKEGEKTIIFINKETIVNKLANELKCLRYYSKYEKKDEEF